jgi:alkaline phosphatase D
MSRLRLFVPAALAVGVLTALASQQSVRGSQRPLVLTHGTASGDVTDSSAIIWGRASGEAQMHVEIATNPAMTGAQSRGTARASAETDFTAHVKVGGLEPNTRYWYRVWLSGAGGRGRSEVSESVVGMFKTAPAATESQPVTFIVGVDVGG